MKGISLALATFAALARPAFAETAWEKLEQGIDIVGECTGDIVKNCAGVLPGEGRIKACMAGHLAELSGACLKALAEPKPAVLSDGDKATSKRIENSHLMRFIEMYLAGIDPGTGDIVAECYGTYANPDIPADKDSVSAGARRGPRHERRSRRNTGCSALPERPEALDSRLV